MKKIDLKPPLWLLLELTHKCPLECPYCYNQLDFAKINDKMKKEDWFKVMERGKREIVQVWRKERRGR